ncbi:polysaccharide biosynthesis/export family protein [Rhodopirellula bahusiensis]|uniref:polysaccharide biosynthesis/export family protein n=1 Tax=Rhodopirellula bahusiensis TaxID=2014065 RepID=UPI003296ED81
MTRSKESILKSVAQTACGLLALAAIGTTGCHQHLVSSAAHAVPAHRLDPELFACSREALGPLPYATLGQPKPAAHRIAAGDTLSVYVFGVFPPNEDETPVQQRTQAVNQRYYPPRGSVVAPATGLPIQVDADGSITLPIVGRVDVNGLTMAETIERITARLIEEEVVQEGKERVTVDLLIPRVKRVVVLREDPPNTQVALVSPQAVDEIHRGSGEVIDLPIYENDVLHALASTGGLPGTDAARELYVIRASAGLNNSFISGGQLQSIVSGGEGGQCNAGVIRIPLAGCPCDNLPFTQEDVILEEGDVVFIPRRNEYFIAGGLLPGGRVPLPRDQDVDIIEAIALASGSAGGPLGQDGSVLANGTPGYLREPSRVLILRTLPDGRQMTIRCDLDRAMKDPKERIRILPDDVVMLQQKPGGAFFNGFLNYFSGDSILVAFTRE